MGLTSSSQVMSQGYRVLTKHQGPLHILTERFVGSLYDSSHAICIFSPIQAAASSASLLKCCMDWDWPNLCLQATIADFSFDHWARTAALRSATSTAA